MKNGHFAFFEPPLGATYNVHLRLIRKHEVDFPLVLIELFLLIVTAEVLRVNISWKSAFVFTPTCSVWPKISCRRGCPTNHSSCHKTRV